MRKDLCASGLIKAIHQKFTKIIDPRKFSKKSNISLRDCLMSCFAVFSLKWPSLLQYEEEEKDPIVLKNLQKLYLIQTPPSDTYMRERLDEIDSCQLRSGFKAVFALAQRGKVLEQYEFLDEYYLFSTDGTGHFSSHKVHCSNCCVKKHGDGSYTYYHNMMGGAIVHPDKREVIPFCPEPIRQQDGMVKNDCEQIASRRQLEALRREHPHLKIIVVQDALSNSGPNVQLLESLKMKYIIVSKKQPFQCRSDLISYHEYIDDIGTLHKYRFVNDIILNGVYLEQKTNYFEWESNSIKNEFKKGSWITNIWITEKNIHQLMRGGRARWKIENETFNTLKNQGYHFEHNFGHGKNHLCTVMSFLMMLAFLVDQLQLICCKSYQEAKHKARTFSSLWEKMRSFFCYIECNNWNEFLGFIAKKKRTDTS
jgi:hypothetical protein